MDFRTLNAIVFVYHYKERWSIRTIRAFFNCDRVYGRRCNEMRVTFSRTLGLGENLNRNKTKRTHIMYDYIRQTAMKKINVICCRWIVLRYITKLSDREECNVLFLFFFRHYRWNALIHNLTYAFVGVDIFYETCGSIHVHNVLDTNLNDITIGFTTHTQRLTPTFRAHAIP